MREYQPYKACEGDYCAACERTLEVGEQSYAKHETGTAVCESCYLKIAEA